MTCQFYDPVNSISVISDGLEGQLFAMKRQFLVLKESCPQQGLNMPPCDQKSEALLSWPHYCTARPSYEKVNVLTVKTGYAFRRTLPFSVFASLLNGHQILQERIYCCRSIFFLLKQNPLSKGFVHKGSKLEVKKVVPLCNKTCLRTA